MFTSQPWSRRTTSLPISPVPTTPTVFPRSSTPYGRGFQPVVAHLAVREGEAAQRRQDHPDRRLGHRVVVRAGRRRDQHAVLGRRVQVDRVVADARPGDDLEERRALDDAARPRLDPGDGGGAIADGLGQHLLLARLVRRHQHQLVAVLDQRSQQLVAGARNLHRRQEHSSHRSSPLPASPERQASGKATVRFHGTTGTECYT